MTKGSQEQQQHRGCATGFIVFVIVVVIGGVVYLINDDAPDPIQPSTTQSPTTTTRLPVTIADPGCPELPRSGLAEMGVPSK